MYVCDTCMYMYVIRVCIKLRHKLKCGHVAIWYMYVHVSEAHHGTSQNSHEAHVQLQLFFWLMTLCDACMHHTSGSPVSMLPQSANLQRSSINATLENGTEDYCCNARRDQYRDQNHTDPMPNLRLDSRIDIPSAHRTYSAVAVIEVAFTTTGATRTRWPVGFAKANILSSRRLIFMYYNTLGKAYMLHFSNTSIIH